MHRVSDGFMRVIMGPTPGEAVIHMGDGTVVDLMARLRLTTRNGSVVEGTLIGNPSAESRHGGPVMVSLRFADDVTAVWSPELGDKLENVRAASDE